MHSGNACASIMFNLCRQGNITNEKWPSDLYRNYTGSLVILDLSFQNIRIMELPRNDLHRTTTGVGHAFRTGHPFPPANIQVLHALKTIPM